VLIAFYLTPLSWINLFSRIESRG